ncbi:cop9 signalosome complex subunit [Anaeramoeba flamelloides]|uniref:Cop9 signalosome complex subunit n=1 Tax=Anaeramoeba flamelloides TaxID=1746091 RepID=A0AAV7YE21_9EUKA|nr:cop9 signalosome complex subunit [Anaeramoeba flamelloides]
MSSEDVLSDFGYSDQSNSGEGFESGSDSGYETGSDSYDDKKPTKPKGKPTKLDLENGYYDSKGLLEEDDDDDAIDDALDGFEKVVKLEIELGGKGIWGFRSLKQVVKLDFEDGEFEEMFEKYDEMLTYIDSAVQTSKSEKCLNSLLNMVSNDKELKAEILEKFYKITLEALKKTGIMRLWFKLNLKLANLWFTKGEYTNLNKILSELKQHCTLKDGSYDINKGTQLLEIFALEIQILGELKQFKKLKDVYQKAKAMETAVPSPKILGIIKESGGKMYLREKRWSKAYLEFFEAFKNFDLAGSPNKIRCLKYLVISSMLKLTDFNPFDIQEVSPYINNKEIEPFVDLVQTYLRDEIDRFEKILQQKKQILEDPIIKFHIPDLFRNIRMKVLVKIIKPYTRIKIDFVAKELNITGKEVEPLLVDLILDEKINAKIDQLTGILEIESAEDQTKYTSLKEWSYHINSIYNNLSSKLI